MIESKRIASGLLAALVLTMSTPARAAADTGVVLDRFFDAYRKGSVDGMLALYGPQAIFEDVNQRHTFQGTDQLREMLTTIVGMHHTIDLRELRRVVQGDTVVVEFEYRGVLSGRALGAAVGKEGCPDLEYVLPTTSWYQVADGRITRQKDFIDFATFLDLREKLLAASKDASDR